MKVSQRLEYACRAMMQLGRSAAGGKVCRVDQLADKEAVSPAFLVQILNDLRRAGLVQSRRGKMGGYCLAKPLEEISLSSIVQAIEGGVLDIDSDRRGESGERVADLWRDVGRELEEKLQSISLQDMLSQDELLDYYI